MGRDMNKNVHQFFKLNLDENKSICNVCGIKLSGNHSTNLRRHLTNKHMDIFNEWNYSGYTKLTQCEEKRRISYQTSEKSIVSSLIIIVTTDGKPFKFLDSEGFNEIMDPIYNALGMNSVTSRNIMNFVSVKEQFVKKNIRALAKGKLVSLIDVATRMDKAILGINLQMIHASLAKTEIVVKTLGMTELGESHTGIYIKNKILEVLDDYGITLDQIYSITSDNGRNMIKAVQVLNDATEESLYEEDIESENLLNELDSIELANIHLVRCAAHTLQLCVFDVNRTKEIADKISACRTLCKSLRTETYR
ncbi:uncharacterized protein LOC133849979 [Drosophila sulfurigaster albostrigata]|uniref:uncharacterized protein LOC133849979 n=1 Tax=Drosophila sulfurigaster albostrigata TaxID=89887 RepID=UPI002D21B13C|nr:uncharacterized protein LOC133849979 [Drosophila sulfurigaster albostrigata]